MNWETILFGLICVALTVVACKSELGERINCNMIHVKAMQEGVYCYEYGEAYYCTRVTRKLIKPVKPTE